MIDTPHVDELPEQAPLRPTNDFPSGGVTVKVTVVPRVNLAGQTLPPLKIRSLLGLRSLLGRNASGCHEGRARAISCAASNSAAAQSALSERHTTDSPSQSRVGISREQITAVSTCPL